MEDIRQLHRTALSRTGYAQKLEVEALALAIIELPEDTAIAQTSYFKEAYEMALPYIQQIASRNKKAKMWAQFWD